MLNEEEKRVLSELKERGGAVELKVGDPQWGEDVLEELRNEGYIRPEYGDLTPDWEGGTIAGKVTIFLKKKGEVALERGDYAAQMSEEAEKLLEQLTPEQAEFLIAVMRQMLKPIKDYVK